MFSLYTALRGQEAKPLYTAVNSEKIAHHYDVFIAGSGPVGAAYARLLVEAGFSVLMVEVGEQDTALRGTHKRNNIGIQKDMGDFTSVMKGALSKVSVAPPPYVVDSFHPGIWPPAKSVRRNGVNPEQNLFRNLSGASIARVVGGMGIYWNNNTPRFQSEERPLLHSNKGESDKEWERLYIEAERLVGTDNTQFTESIRHNLVLRTLQGFEGRTFEHLPLACTRVSPKYVDWHSSHTVFDMESRPNEKDPTGRFNLSPATVCRKLIYDSNNKITAARIQTLQDDQYYEISADVFIIAAGAVCTPQILVNSGLASFGPVQRPNSKIPYLGQYITEQTMIYCQTIFYKQVIEEVTADIATTGVPGHPAYNATYSKSPNNKNPDWWNERVVAHMMAHQDDPIPIPFDDPEPQVTTLFNSEGGKPWHTQIRRDAFSYGPLSEAVDSRLIADICFYGRTQPHAENKLFFSEKVTDLYGMPQPTFDFKSPTGQTTEEAVKMMADMVNIAFKLGGFLPGSEPKYTEPGSALHLGGTHRAGLVRDGPNPEDKSVVDVNSKVWDFPNLFLGGVGNIPSAFASNPTLTAVGYAFKSCEYIKDHFTPSRR